MSGRLVRAGAAVRLTLGLCGAGRDAAKRVAWVGVAAWDVGLDWMLTSAFVLALAWFGLVLVAVRIIRFVCSVVLACVRRRGMRCDVGVLADASSF